MNNRRVLLAAGLLVAAACAKHPSAKPATCTAAACVTMHQQCYVSLPDEPDYAWCVGNLPPPPDGGALPADPDSCLQVCNADHEAEFIQCFADNASACVPPGAEPSLIAHCQSEQAQVSKSVSAHCDDVCQVARATCRGCVPRHGLRLLLPVLLSSARSRRSPGRQACPSEPAHCSDGTKNNNETDVDCGGECGPCVEGKFCAVSTDCVSGQCAGNMCAPVLACARVGDCPQNACLEGTCR